jgi:hypothetical protein
MKLVLLLVVLGLGACGVIQDDLPCDEPSAKRAGEVFAECLQKHNGPVGGYCGRAANTAMCRPKKYRDPNP